MLIDYEDASYQAAVQNAYLRKGCTLIDAKCHVEEAVHRMYAVPVKALADDIDSQVLAAISRGDDPRC